MKRIWIFGMLAMIGTSTAGTTAARADIIIEHGTVMRVPDPSFRYTFQTVLTDIPNPPGVEVAFGDFFTVYDLKGIILGTNTQPDNWAATFNLVGTNPVGTSSPDDPAIYNVTWTYVGELPLLAPETLGSFSVQSSDGSLKNLAYAGQDTLLTGGPSGNMGSVPITTVPEPSSFLLAGLGLSSGWFVFRRRRGPTGGRSARPGRGLLGDGHQGLEGVARA